MHDPKHDIDELFYNNIEGYSVHPPDRVWDKIDAELDKVNYKRKYYRLRTSALVLLVCLIGFIIYEGRNLYYKGKSINDKDLVVKTDAEQENGSADKNNVQTVANNSEAVQDREVLNEEGSVIKGLTGQSKSINTAQLFAGTEQSDGNKFVSETISSSNTKENMISSVAIEPKSSSDQNSISFSSLTDGSWKKNLLMNDQSSLPVSSAATSSNIDRRPVNTTKERSSRLSLSAFFMPNLAWNEINDNGDNRRRRNRSGNNSGSNNNGNNNGNGSNSNNGSSSNGNNNGNGNNNNGGSNNGSGGRNHHNSRRYINQSESEQFAYSAGVKLNYSVSKKISVETGLNYLTSTTDVKPRKVYAEKDRHGKTGYRLNCSSGYSILQSKSQTPQAGDSIIAKDTRNHISYLGVPVAVEYKIFSKGKFSLNATAGAQANILLTANTKTVLAKNPSPETVKTKIEGLQPVYFSVVAGVEAEMQLNKSLSVTLAPVGQFGITNINKTTPVNTHPQYVGLSAGLKLKL